MYRITFFQFTFSGPGVFFISVITFCASIPSSSTACLATAVTFLIIIIDINIYFCISPSKHTPTHHRLYLYIYNLEVYRYLPISHRFVFAFFT